AEAQVKVMTTSEIEAKIATAKDFYGFYQDLGPKYQKIALSGIETDLKNPKNSNSDEYFWTMFANNIEKANSQKTADKKASANAAKSNLEGLQNVAKGIK
ncbi:MAG: hypothetical protein PHF46_05175, partial [Candidatus Gracilibacteria bacterium]|nr:hypothetical protein [Candidatus Gracilibacteria bacterium]